MGISQLNANEWQVGMAVVWRRARDGRMYCWACSSETCEHVQSLWDYLGEGDK